MDLQLTTANYDRLGSRTVTMRWFRYRDGFVIEMVSLEMQQMASVDPSYWKITELIIINHHND